MKPMIRVILVIVCILASTLVFLPLVRERDAQVDAARLSLEKQVLINADLTQKIEDLKAAYRLLATDPKIPYRPVVRPNRWCGPAINTQQMQNPYKKVISYVAYQEDNAAPADLWIAAGIADNERLRKLYFPDWVSRGYILSPSPGIEKVMLQNNWEVVRCDVPKRIHFTRLFRFLVYDDDVYAFLSRDVDSRLSPREMFLVNEWMSSNFTFHTIRDHNQHGTPILAGLFGMKRGAMAPLRMAELMQFATRSPDPIPGGFGVMGEDQNFLQTHLWDHVRENALEHDSHGRCYGGKECVPFPSIAGEWTTQSFVGIPDKSGLHYMPNCTISCNYYWHP